MKILKFGDNKKYSSIFTTPRFIITPKSFRPSQDLVFIYAKC